MPHREECYESCDCPENKTCSRCGGIGAHINYCQYLEVDLSPDTDAAGATAKIEQVALNNDYMCIKKSLLCYTYCVILYSEGRKTK